ncbi:MAG: molybdopterin oxidoreductase family protein [Gemmataceae bacterium]
MSETRREFLRTAGGVGLVAGLGAGTWGALELFLPDGTADTWHKSVCRYCGTGCGVRVGMRGGKISDVRGDESAHNRGVICVKGATLPRLNALPGRLTRPLVRKGGALAEASWDEAMALVASRFRDAIGRGKDRVAFYGSGQLFIEESYTANKLFKAGVGTNNVDGNPRLCMASAAAGYTQVFGKDEPCGTFEDVDHAECFFLFGANPAECHPPVFERIRQRQKNHPGTVVITVDPRRTRTAEVSTVHLPVIPGTDLLLLNAMMQVIVADGLTDAAFMKEHVRVSDGAKTLDLGAAKGWLADYTPAKVADRVGLSAAMIRDVAYRFARSKATLSMWTMGANQRTQGTAINTALMGLHLLTGQIGRPGASPLSLTGQSNACGGVRDTGALAHALPGGRAVANPAHRAEMEDLWGVPRGTISPNVGHDALALFRAMEAGTVEAALVMCTNPAQSLPAAARYRPAMEKAFLVVADVFADTETAKLADVVLPAALWVEKEGVYGQTDRHYQLIEKLLDPPGEARNDLAILVDLADRLGHGALIKARTPEAVWDEWRAISAKSYYNFEGMTRQRLRAEHGIQWPCPTEDHPGTKRRYVGGDDPFVARGKALEFYGQPDKRAVVFLRAYVEPPERPSADFPLLLTTGRVLEQWHTGTMTGRVAELAKASGPGHFEMHAADAGPLGLRDGDRAELSSRYGKLTGAVKVTASPRPGVVFAAFYDAKFLINDVVADHADAVSKEPEYKVTAVSVRKVEGAS